MDFEHCSVLLEETVEQLKIKPDGIYVDGTLGGGGHASRVCEKLEEGRLYGIDQDEAAIRAAGERLAGFGERAVLIRGNYVDAKALLAEKGVEKVDGILLDLGVSSYQLDTPERGFSYRWDAELDMRMDQRQRLTAKDIVNGCSEEQLARILYDYGEEPSARRIAREIVRARQSHPIETTGELSEIIREAVPARMRTGGHPAKRTFQAIRIECNRELEVLRDALGDLTDMLRPGGRLCIITFHSLEDRIVKTAFKTKENPCICPPDFPVCVCGRKPEGRVITRKPILPSAQEIERNSRSKSAKLRVFEKI